MDLPTAVAMAKRDRWMCLCVLKNHKMYNYKEARCSCGGIVHRRRKWPRRLMLRERDHKLCEFSSSGSVEEISFRCFRCALCGVSSPFWTIRARINCVTPLIKTTFKKIKSNIIKYALSDGWCQFRMPEEFLCGTHETIDRSPAYRYKQRCNLSSICDLRFAKTKQQQQKILNSSFA